MHKLTRITLSLIACLCISQNARAAAIVVNDAGDAPDATPGDGICETATGNGICTLRAAIMEANALSGADMVSFANGINTITLSIPGDSENDGASGDLDVRESLTIQGNGRDVTIIDGGALDRVFHVIDPTFTPGQVLLTLREITLRNGGIDDNGAGIRVDDYAALQLDAARISDNRSPQNSYRSGGGIYLGYGGALTVTASEIISNAAGAGGAGLHSAGASVYISGSHIVANRSLAYEQPSGTGGGISVNDAPLTLIDSVVADNLAGSGGGAQSYNAQVIILRSMFHGNRAYSGGGYSADYGTNVRIEDSAFFNNVADSGGGLSFGLDAGGAISNTTIAQNWALYDGGGLYGSDYSDYQPGIRLTHVTLARNRADRDGGGVFAAAHVSLLNSVVGANSSGGSGPDCLVNTYSGSLTSLGNSLLQNTVDCVNYVVAAGDLIDLDPQLGTILISGEHPGAATLPMLTASPARNAGAACASLDQRGLPRDAACDIGAHEQQTSVVASLSGRVFADLDRDGLFAGGDYGISNTLLLVNAALRAHTDLDGRFVLAGLAAGQLVVREVQPAGFPDGSDTLGDAGGTLGNDVFTVTLASGQDATGYLFGELTPARLRGRVFADADRNGEYGGTHDAGFQGVVITLTGVTSESQAVLRTFTTDYDGLFVFDLLAPGSYTLTGSQPDGAFDFNEIIGSMGGQIAGDAPQNDVIGQIVLNYGDDGSGYAFTELNALQLQIVSFVDGNADTFFNGGEPGLFGVTFTVSGVDYRGNPGSSVISDPFNAYVYITLPPGTYTVTQTQPDGVLDGPDFACSAENGIAGNDVIRNIRLENGVGSCVSFTEQYDGIAGRVVLDGNNNGLDDGEGGLETVVTLSGTAGSGASMLISTSTDGSGNFLFANIPTGTYALSALQVDFLYGSLPLIDGLEQIGQAGGITSSALGHNLITGIVYTPGQPASGYTFGEMIARRIRGMVFVDQNTNGVFENTFCSYFSPGNRYCDPTLAGVTIVLTGTDQFGAAAYITTSTANAAIDYPIYNARDVYTFFVRPGVYSVIEQQPFGTADGFPDAPFGSAIAGDNRFDGIDMQNNNVREFISFGELPAGIAGSVFYDNNNDGVRQANEGGVQGVQITLRHASAGGSGISTTVTNFSGRYFFAIGFAGTFTLTQQPQGQFPLNNLLDGREQVAALTLGGAFSATSNDEYAGFALAAGESGGGFNFGELAPARIETGAFHDRDANAAYDNGGDLFIPGARVVLTGVNDLGAIGPITYDVNCANFYGNICINNLRPGTYALTLLSISSFRPLTSVVDAYNSGIGGSPGVRSIDNIVLPAGGNASGYAFGELREGISGFVYRDVNHNRVRDLEFGPYASFNIVLSSTTGALLATSADYYSGYYEFVNVPDGIYRLTAQGADVASSLIDWFEQVGSLGGISGTTIGQDVISAINYSNSAPATNYNFGKVEETRIYGSVFVDTNNDGEQQEYLGETGIAGVTITISGSDELGQNIMIVTQTNQAGTFEFNRLYGGIYAVSETQPDGYSDGNEGFPFYYTHVRVMDNDRFVVTSTLPDGSTQGGPLYFGERLSGLTGYVYIDLNNDGARQINEGGVSAATLMISGSRSAGGTYSATTLSSLSGFFSFSDVPPGEYALIALQPADLIDGRDTAGTAGGTAGALGTDLISGIVITEATFGQDYLFGERIPARIAGQVYLDADDDGFYSGVDVVLNGVTMTVQGVDDLGGAVSVSLSTQDFGYFNFYLRPGSYTLTQRQPVGYGDGLDRFRNGPPSVLNDTFSDLSVLSGQILDGFTFGERVLALRGAVVEDTNANGRVDAGEIGFAGFTILLTGTLAGDGSDYVSSTQTSANGVWQFIDLPAGTYTISERQPATWLHVATLSGTLGGEVAIDVIRDIVISNNTGSGYTFLDARAGSISGNVYHDLNNNAFIDGGEPGIAGVTVTLSGIDYRGVPTERVQATAANGRFSFGTLRPGIYTIAESQPEGYTDGRDSGGNAGGAIGQDVISGIVISSNFNADGHAFGERQVGLIGSVYVDRNNNGVRELNDNGIPAVLLTLSGTSTLGTPVFLSTTTNGTGLFTFGDVPSGTYTLIETQPQGYLDGIDVAGSAGGLPGDDMISGIVITEATFGTGSLFGELEPGRITGIVFIDLDDDGRQDLGEAGIGGVTLTLNGRDDRLQTVNRTITTSAGGGFDLGLLRPGVYAISETQPANYSDGRERDATGNFSPRNDGFDDIFVGPGATAGPFSFGESSNFIAGSVFLDVNNDGVFAGGDAPLSGVTIRLAGLRASDGGALNAVTRTNDAGLWAFVNLPFGTYTITENQPASFLDGREQVGSLAGTVGNDSFANIVLNGSGALGYTFGELNPAQLRGSVYHDANGSGARDGGEAGIAQVALTLSGNDDRGMAVSRNTQTDANGGFTFDQLRPGFYALVETQPAAFSQGNNAAGSAGGNIGGDTITSIVIQPGQFADGYLFGETQFGLSGHVFFDANNNGVREVGEAGIGNVVIVVTGTTTSGQEINRNTQSDGGGYWIIPNLPAGSYRARELQPFGLFDGREQIGSLGGVTLPDAFDVTLSANQIGRDYNFGELVGARLRGTVYLDVNNSGTQNNDEPGIPAALIRLNGTDDLGNTVERVLYTDDNGRFDFGNLRPGSYTLSETQPAGFVDGLDAAGSAGGVPGNDLISSITVLPGVNTDGYLFGERISGISGYVFNDGDNNGLRAAGEAGIANVSILLTGTASAGAPITRTALTNGAGFYAFGDLAEGSYRISEIQPATWMDGRDRAGAQGGSVDVLGSDNIDLVFSGGYAEGYLFGELTPGKVAGYVFFDINDNGRFEWSECPDDSGLCTGDADSVDRGVGSGVQIVLNGTNDLNQGVLMTVGTQASGYWEFPSLRPGVYTVRQQQRDVDVDGRDTRLIATRVTTPALINDTLDDLTLPVGGLVGGTFAEQPSIMGHVYRDDNDNGVREPDGGICSTPEFGIGDVNIQLSGVDIFNRPVNLSTSSKRIVQNQNCNEGLWYFGGLVTGTYDIREVQPARYLDGSEQLGNGGGLTTTNDVFSRIVFTPGRVITGYTFGELRNAIAGSVYLDVNGDAAYSYGIDPANIEATILLSGVTDLGSTITRSMQSAGNWEFTSLRPGVYTITELQPAGYDDAAETLGGGIGVSARIAGNDQFVITLTAGALAEGFHFGETSDGGIYGNITYWPFPDWPYAYATRPITGEQIRLNGVTFEGATVLSNSITDGGGNYFFEALKPGVYAVTQVGFPNGYTSEPVALCGASYEPLDRVHDGIVLGYGQVRLCSFRLGSPIRGNVWVDNNGDGVPDGSGIGGVKLELGGDAVRMNTLSAGCGPYDPCGRFAFAPVPSGIYAITQTQPAYEDGTDFAGTAGGVTMVITQGSLLTDVISGISYTHTPFNIASGYRFGERSPAGIVATVNYDRNENGIADDAEGFIANALVRLTGIDDLGRSIDITRSSSSRDGLIWGGLRPGLYTLTEQQPAGYTDWADIAGNKGGEIRNDEFANIALTWGDSAGGYVFNERRSGIIGTVFGDLNNNGVYEPFAGETGIAGVIVTLTGNSILNGPQLLTTSTDGRGIFGFADLGAGTYALGEQQPQAGLYDDGGERAGTLGGNASGLIGDDRIENIVLGQQLFGEGYTFGEVPLGTLGGQVFVDANGNAARDAGEVGIGGVLITLTGNLNNGGSVLITQTTAASGGFSFVTLRAGTYALAERQPNFLDGLDAAGSAGGIALNDNIIGIAIRAGTRAIDYRFGERSSGVSGFVYRDENGDGARQITETGLAPVTIKLSGRDFAGNGVNKTTTTNNGGFYIFDVQPGTYRIDEVQPFGSLTGTAQAGNFGGTLVGGNTISDVLLPSGQAGSNYNFADVPPTAAELAAALGLDPGSVISAVLEVDGINKAGLGGLTRASLLGYPTEGGTFAYLGTGNMIFADLPNTQPNTFGLGEVARLSIMFTPPPTATCLALDFTFLSEEFPEFVGSQFNDAFESHLDGVPFARDGQGNRITINSVFGASPANSAGSTYDAGTLRLRAQTPVTPGVASLLTFVISDAVDSAYDSAVLLDRVRFSAPGRGCDAGADYPINIVLSKTVNTLPVAGNHEITVDRGEEVYHIYTVQNSGDYALVLHTLTDTVFGTLFSDLALTLAPGELHDFITSRIETETNTSAAAWTAIFSGTQGTQAIDSTTVTVRQPPTPSPTPLAGNARLSLQPDAISLSPGQRISIALVISDGLNIGGFESEIDFDPAVLTVTRVVIGDLLAAGGRSVIPLGTVLLGNAVRFGAASIGAAPGSSSAGVLAWIEIEARAAGSSALDLRASLVSNDRSQRVAVSEADGVVVVQTATSTSTFTPAPTPTSMPSPSSTPTPTSTPSSTSTPTSTPSPTSTSTPTFTSTPTGTPATCTITCAGSVTQMQLQLIYRSASALANAQRERVRVRVAHSSDQQGTLNPSGAVLFDNDPDGYAGGAAPNPLLAPGSVFGINIPANTARIVVSVHDASHPQEYVKAVFKTDCAQLPGAVDGNSYIGFMIGALTSNAGPHAGIARRAEAEFGQLSSLMRVYTNDDASGRRAVGEFDNVGQGVTLTLNMPVAGTHQLRLRYSADTHTTNLRSIHVNGVLISDAINFPNTGAWDEFSTLAMEGISLNAGANAVRVSRDSAAQTGTIDLDYIEARATRDCAGATPTSVGGTPTPTATPTSVGATPTVVGGTPSGAQCVKEGTCFKVEFLGYQSLQNGETQLNWRITNTCRHDVSYVAFGTGDFARVSPTSGGTVAGTLGQHLVTWTGASGNPGFKSIKYSPVNNAFNFAERELYSYRVRNFDPNERIRVKIHAGRINETSSWQFNTANCSCEALAAPAAGSGSSLTLYSWPPSGSQVQVGSVISYYVLLERHADRLARVGEDGDTAIITSDVAPGLQVRADEITDGGIVENGKVLWTESLESDDSLLRVYAVQVTEALSRARGTLLAVQASVDFSATTTGSNRVLHRVGGTGSVFLPVVSTFSGN